jgi:hypothetical protein
MSTTLTVTGQGIRFIQYIETILHVRIEILLDVCFNLVKMKNYYKKTGGMGDM